jgi:hypothetical protein
MYHPGRDHSQAKLPFFMVIAFLDPIFKFMEMISTLLHL